MDWSINFPVSDNIYSVGKGLKDAGTSLKQGQHEIGEISLEWIDEREKENLWFIEQGFRSAGQGGKTERWMP